MSYLSKINLSRRLVIAVLTVCLVLGMANVQVIAAAADSSAGVYGGTGDEPDMFDDGIGTGASSDGDVENNGTDDEPDTSGDEPETDASSDGDAENNGTDDAPDTSGDEPETDASSDGDVENDGTDDEPDISGDEPESDATGDSSAEYDDTDDIPSMSGDESEADANSDDTDEYDSEYDELGVPETDENGKDIVVELPTEEAVVFTIDPHPLYLPEGQPIAEADLLVDVTAMDENGENVAVTVKDTGGLDLQNPATHTVMFTPYIITYAAEHPITGNEFNITREVYVTAGFVPLSTAGDLKTTIEGFIPGIGINNDLSATVNGNEVVVTGSINGALTTLNLNIDAGVTVKWAATLTGTVDFTTSKLGLININGGSGKFEVVSGGTISNAGTAPTIAIGSRGTGVEISGGTVQATNTSDYARAIYAYIDNTDITISGGLVESVSSGTTGNTIFADKAGSYVTVSGGLVHNKGGSYAINVTGDSGVIVISGGEVTCDTSTNQLWAINVSKDAAILVYGNPIISKPIIGNSNAKAYYIGNNSQLFPDNVGGKKSGFTEGTNLFRLDTLELTRNAADGESYVYDDTALPYLGNVVASLPAGFNATSITVNGTSSSNYTVDLTEGTVTFSGLFDTGLNGLTITAEGTLENGRINVPSFTTQPFGVRITNAMPINVTDSNGYNQGFTDLSSAVAAINNDSGTGPYTIKIVEDVTEPARIALPSKPVIITGTTGKVLTFASGNANIFVEAKADTTFENITIDGGFFYGNGHKIVFGNGITQFGTKNTFEQVFGGSYYSNLTGNTDISIASGNFGGVYGGVNAVIGDFYLYGDTNISVSGGTVESLFGGGGNSLSMITGNTNVTVSGGTIETVSGGGYSMQIRGSSNVNISGGTINDGVYGGSINPGGSTISGDTNVTVSGGTINCALSGGANNCSVDGTRALILSGLTGINYPSSITTDPIINFDIIKLADGASINAATNPTIDNNLGGVGTIIATSGKLTVNGDMNATLSFDLTGRNIGDTVLTAKNTSIGTAAGNAGLGIERTANGSLYDWKVIGMTYGISLNQPSYYTFPEVVYGYGSQTALNVTVRNVGGQPTGPLTVALTGTDAGCFSLSTNAINSIMTNGGTDSFTIDIVTGLVPGVYSADITVSGGNGISQSFNISFTVNPKPLTVTASDINIQVGDSEPTYTYTVDGLIGGDTAAAVIITPPTLSVANFNSAAPAVFPIAISDGETTANYTIGTYVNGTLTVEGAMPTYYYTVTVINGSGSGNYEPGATVTVTANPNPIGKTFFGWISNDGVIFASPYPKTTSFIMPAKNVTVTASFSDISINTPIPTATPSPNATSEPTVSPVPTATPEPTVSPVPTATPEPTVSPAPMLSPVSTPLSIPGFGGDSVAAVTIPIITDVDTGKIIVDMGVETADILINDAKSFAQLNNTQPVVSFDVREVNEAKSVSLNVEAVQAFANEDVTLDVLLPDAKITLDPGALATLAASGSGAIPVTVEAVVVPLTELTGMQAAQVMDYETVINIDIFVGDNKVDVPITISLPYTLKDGEDPAAVCVWHLDAHGELTKLGGMYDPATGEITFTVDHQSYFAVRYDPVALWKNIFSDITEDVWYYDAIAYVNHYGLFSGYGDGTMAPLDNMTRAMFVTVLYQLEGFPEPNVTKSFSDVPMDVWYHNPVVWAAETGITSGIGAGLFAPDRAITRQEMVAILLNYAYFKGYDIPQYRTQTFSDNNKVEHWAELAVKLLYEAGVVSGDNDAFMPVKTATRAEAAQMYKNFLRLVVIDRENLPANAPVATYTTPMIEFHFSRSSTDIKKPA